MEPKTSTPELLYHTCLTVKGEPTGGSAFPHIYVLGTHSTVPSAKEFCLSVLPSLGYDRTDFEVYEEHKPEQNEAWKHGDGVVVYSKTLAGQECFVSIDTKLNTGGLQASSDGNMVLSSGTDHLHYVLQATLEYSHDREAKVEIQGAYLRRYDAIEAAKLVLLYEGTIPDDFEEYDTLEDIHNTQNWPYGEDVVVHAVKATGENYKIAVRSPPLAHTRHRRRKPD